MTESNVQDYISSIAVSKYLKPNLPPWQICVIPILSTGSSAVTRSDEPVPSTSASSSNQSAPAVEEEQQQSTTSESSSVNRQKNSLKPFKMIKKSIRLLYLVCTHIFVFVCV